MKRMKKILSGIILGCMVVTSVFPAAAEIPDFPENPVSETEIMEVTGTEEELSVEEVVEIEETESVVSSWEKERERRMNAPAGKAGPEKSPEELPDQYVDGEVIAIVKGGASALFGNGDLLGAAEGVPEFTVEETLVWIEDKTPAGSLPEEMPGIEEVTEAGFLQAAPAEEVLLLSCEDTEQTVDYLNGLSGVVCAQPNYIISVDSYGTEEPFYDFQWGLDNQNTSDTEPADIRAGEAWEELGDAGEKDIVVAVMDSGVDYTHPDLEPVMWKDGLNYPELTALGGGRYGINYDGTGDPGDPMDTDCGHGTHCSSVIAGAWKNQEGTAGVNGNVKIMACRWMGAGSGLSSNACKAYGYILAAKEAGVNVRVVNNSWGSGVSVSSTLPVIGYLVRKAGEMGILSCFSAGNESLNLDGYPNLNYSVRDYMLVVGAMDSGGEPAFFSNFGQTTVDVFAPGVGILAATTLQEGDMISMKPGYLPWLSGAEESILYEDFEGTEEPSVWLRAKNGAKVATSSTAVRKLAGKDENRTAGVKYRMVEGETLSFDIEAALTEEEITAISAAEKICLSFQMVFGSCGQAKPKDFFLHTWDAEIGEWVPTEKRVRNLDSNWNQFSTELSAEELLGSMEGNILTLRFISGEEMPVTAEGGELLLDTFGLGTEPGKYCYASGTSMAAPMVAGVASLVMSKLLAEEPALTGSALTREVMALVRGGTVPKEPFDTKCRTGGYVNAAASLKGSAAMRPVPDTYAETGTEAVLTGWFFGGTPGTVAMDGTSVEVLSWDDRRISFVCDPETVEHMAEITVETAEGRSGRGFFTVGTKPEGYTFLSVPDEDLNQVLLGAAGDTVLAAANHADPDGKEKIEFWKYTIPEDQWKKIDGPSENVMSILPMYTSHLASGKTEIYYLYGKEEPGVDSNTWMATYDIEEERWTYDVEISEAADSMTMPVVYNGELLLVGGDMTGKVRKIYPDTGVVYGTLPDLCRDAGGGMAVQLGEDLYVNGTVSSLLDLAFSAEISGEIFQNMMRYSPASGAWTESSAVFFPDSEGHSQYLDENMLCQSASVPLKDQIMLFGPAKNNAEATMTDTWIYDPEEDRFHAAENARFDTVRTRNISAAAAGGRVYVIGNSGRNDGEGALRFAVLDPGENAPAVPENAKKDDGSLIIQLGDEYLENGYYLQGTDGKLTREGASEENYQLYVDRAGSRLIMKDLDFRYASDEMMDYSDKVMLRANGDLTIEVIGDNTLSFSREYDENFLFAPMKSSVTLRVEGKLTLTGNGTLTVNGVEQSMDSTAVRAEEILVNGPTLIAFADSKAIYDEKTGVSRALSVLPHSASFRLSCMFGGNGEEAAAGGEKRMSALEPVLDTAKYVKILAHTDDHKGHSGSSHSESPVYTGTWGAPVTGGTWRVSADGTWTYTTNAMFRNTWGYIRYMSNGAWMDSWFWFDRDGKMLSGWQFIGGKWYYLNPVHDGTFGACLLGPGKTPDGYEIDENGAWTGK